jgi:uncharacterized coiled-coil protein SlyX
MAKRTISLDDETKSAFDELQAQLGAPSATEALSRLIENYRQAQAERTIADAHVAGMERVSGYLEDARRNMYLVLADIQEGNEAERKTLNSRIEALEVRAKERDDRIAELEGQVAERDSELVGLRAKAASVDALAERLRHSEEENARRFDQILSAITVVQSDNLSIMQIGEDLVCAHYQEGTLLNDPLNGESRTEAAKARRMAKG